MSFAMISGTLIDSDATPWINALWSVVPVSPSSPPVFEDGSPVLAVFGQLDDTAVFSGSIPRTDSIKPNGTTLTLTVYSVTSAPPAVIPNVSITTSTVDLGALLSPRIPAPRIPAAALVYAYGDGEIIGATHGTGYINTSSNQAFLFVGETWVAVGNEANEGPPGPAGPAGPAGPTIYPASGVAVSTGTAWDTSIVPSSIVRTTIGLGSGADLNTVTGCGTYVGVSFVNLPTPGPDATMVFLTVVSNPFSANWLTQTLLPGASNDGAFWIRHLINGVWNPWQMYVAST